MPGRRKLVLPLLVVAIIAAIGLYRKFAVKEICPDALCTVTVGSVDLTTAWPIWLDGSRLVFEGLREGKRAYDTDTKLSDFRLFIWKVGDREVVRQHEAWKPLQGYCASDGTLMFSEGAEGKIGNQTITYWRGKPFSEIRIEKHLVTEPGRHRESDVFDTFICDYVERGAGVDRRGRHLRPEHGFFDEGPLDFYGRKGPDPAPRLIRSDGQAPIELPIPPNEALSEYLSFDQFLNAYLVYNARIASTKESLERLGDCYPFWLFWPDGRTERRCVPIGPWVGIPGIRLAVTKVGAVFASNLEKYAGLYWVSGESRKKVTKLFDGWTTRPITSPDGCRVATTVEGSKQLSIPANEHRVVVVDFCVKGKG